MPSGPGAVVPRLFGHAQEDKNDSDFVKAFQAVIARKRLGSSKKSKLTKLVADLSSDPDAADEKKLELYSCFTWMMDSVTKFQLCELIKSRKAASAAAIVLKEDGKKKKSLTSIAASADSLRRFIESDSEDAEEDVKETDPQKDFGGEESAEGNGNEAMDESAPLVIYS